MGNPHSEPKLPAQQLIILSICRFAEPLGLTSVFPYIPEMVESFDVPKKEVAKWAGLISAVFSLCQAITGVAWGRASDRYGRKPVILIAMTCAMVSTVAFGFSRSIAWAIVTRSIMGASSGNVGIIRTTVAEMVPQKILQPQAFSIMPLTWTIGSIFGPSIGGALAKPATTFPDLFGNSAFLKKYPFAFPNLIISCFFVISISVGVLFLKETHVVKKHERDYGRVVGQMIIHFFRARKPKYEGDDLDESSPLLKNQWVSSSAMNNANRENRDSPAKADDDPPLGYRDVFSPQSSINLVVYTLLALHSVAFDQILPVFLHLPPQENRSANPDVAFPFKFAGGFGLDAARIGMFFTTSGIIGMLVQFFIFPPMARRFGVLYCLKACTIALPLIYLLTPFTVLFPTNTGRQTAMFGIILFKCFAAIFAFPCSTILLTNSARSLRLLGTLNGVATSVSALGRAAGPSIGGLMFSWGIGLGYIVIPWWTIALFAALGNVPVWWLIETDGFGEEDDNMKGTIGEESEPHSSGDADGQRLPSNPAETPKRAKPDADDDDSEREAEVAFKDDHSLRKISSPIGMGEGVGPGGGKIPSNGLGPSMNELGVGGSSYH